MDNSYLDRTAGLRRFVEGPENNIPTVGSVKKFIALASEAQQPGSGLQQIQEVQSVPSAPPEPPGALAKFASAFIPGLAGSLQKNYMNKASEYLESLPTYEEKVKYLASQNPGKYMPAMLELSNPMRKYQLETLQDESAGREGIKSTSVNLSKMIPGGGSGPIGVQANNPLNIRYSPDNDWKGQVGNIKGFAQFSDPREGARAAAINMSSYAKDGVNTLSGLVSKWAPPTENDTQSYIAKVEKMTGIPRDAEIDLKDGDMQKTLITAMQNVELGPQNAFPIQVISEGVDMAHKTDAEENKNLGSVSQFSKNSQFAKTYLDLASKTGRPEFLNKGMEIMMAPEISDDQIKNEGTFRKEFYSNNADYVKIRDAYNRVETSYKKASPAGDMSMIFNYMKILDPGSTVREGEYATAANAGSVPDRVLAAYNNILKGDKLAPAMRDDFLGAARDLYKSQLKTYKNTEKQYKGIAAQYGYGPERVVPDLTEGTIPMEAATPTGAAPTGYENLSDEEILKRLGK